MITGQIEIIDVNGNKIDREIEPGDIVTPTYRDDYGFAEYFYEQLTDEYKRIFLEKFNLKSIEE